VPGAIDEPWLRVVEDTQRQAAEAHAAFLRVMADSHQAYLGMAEATLTGLLAAATGQPVQPRPRTVAGPPAVPELTAAPMETPAVPHQPAAVRHQVPAAPYQPAAMQVPVAPQPRQAAQPPTPEPLVTRPPAPERSNGTAPTPPPTAGDLGNPGPGSEPRISKIAEGGVDIETLLLDIVADRTGFPVEILNADMELDTELGIDSIKRVEILSAVRERLGDLPTADPAALTAGRTLREIAEALQSRPAEAVQPDDSVPSEEPSQGERTLPRAVLHAVEAPRSGLAIPGLSTGTVAVTDDGRGVAPLVVAGLRRHGIAADVVQRIRPDTETGVILLDGLRPVADVTSATTAQRTAFRAARALAGRMAAHGGVFVTVQDTGGDFGLGARQPARAWVGGLAALARTAAKEWPRAVVKAIDCATKGRSAADVADAIVAELLGGAGAPAVGLRADGVRIVPEPIAQSIVDTTARIGPDSVVVATGGARGVTAACLRLLAAKRQPKLVLLGRTPLSAEPPGLAAATDEAGLIALLAAGEPGSPSQLADRARRVLAVREIRDTLAAIERDGGTARYVSIDVRDAEALSWALDAVRRDWGPITALVHGAGVLADAPIAETTNEQFGRVFDTKVQGLRALLAATADDPLEVLCAFSSVAAVFGNAGQAGYAMANEVLNQVLAAERARRPRCLVRSIAWGPWAGGMVTPTIAARLREAGVALIDPDAGARAFLGEIDGPADGVVVVRAVADPMQDKGFTAEVTVTAGAHEYLADHRVNGVAVVPVATVLDWFAGAAAAWRPGAGSVIRDLRVLDEIALPRLDDGGHRLVLRGHESTVEDGPALDLDLRDDAGHPHFRASVAAAPPSEPRPWAAPRDLAPLDDPYDGTTLFHGPALRAVRGAPAVGAGGADGMVAGVGALAWATRPSIVDIAAVDGALQLALLWARRAGAGDTLPMSVGECRVYRAGPVEGEVRCVVRGLRADDAGAVCDVALLEFDGGPVLELLDVHLVRRPGP